MRKHVLLTFSILGTMIGSLVAQNKELPKLNTNDLQKSIIGRDVVQAFARAEEGAPLRYVAIGGSITEAGEGWIGGWLRRQFPGSQVMNVNAGISGTGSSLAVFRIERDVIAYQPDLVAIEFCVNDQGHPDEDVTLYMESLIVRLKSLPQPPAIIILEAADRNGVNLARHRRVAQHYGLLEVDLQDAIDLHLKATGQTWPDLFGDSVHPNKDGHTLYRTTIEMALQPLADEARRDAKSETLASALPAPLSTRPLVLDGRMMPLQALRDASGKWSSEPAPHAHSARFFQGVLSANEPGAALRIPFRGTTFGVFFPMDKHYGSFYMNVDGGMPHHIYTNSRDGYSSVILTSTLAAREHLLTLVLPQPEAPISGKPTVNGPVKLGYLLVAGETGATRKRSPQGPFDIDAMRGLRFKAVPASAWSWTGPFLANEAGQTSVDAQHTIAQNFLGEGPNQAPPKASSTAWHTISREGSLVDFQDLAGVREPAIVYAAAQISSAKGELAILAFDIDYYAQIWLNGELILTMDSLHPRPILLSVKLLPGENSVICKVGAGSAGFSMQLSVAETSPHE